jgi:hypothetical protein
MHCTVRMYASISRSLDVRYSRQRPVPPQVTLTGWQRSPTFRLVQARRGYNAVSSLDIAWLQVSSGYLDLSFVALLLPKCTWPCGSSVPSDVSYRHCLQSDIESLVPEAGIASLILGSATKAPLPVCAPPQADPRILRGAVRSTESLIYAVLYIRALSC